MNEIYENLDDKILLKTKFANFYGQKSRGVLHVTGSGKLILTENELFFHQYLPKTIMHIPLSNIIGIETPKKFLSNYSGSRLLKVIYEDENGHEDEVAWVIPKLKKWIEILAPNSNKYCRFCESELKPYVYICSNCGTNLREFK
ncbi:MAG: hypothetical protein ACFFBP_03800 [Promethearchaeota archaeon]